MTESSTVLQPPLRVSLIINRYAGQQLVQGQQLSSQLAAYFVKQGCLLEMYQPENFDAFTQAIDQALLQHTDRAGILVAAGGDGTLNAVAHRLWQAQQHTPCLREVKLGIIPLGTFNYVARALQIPLDPFQAAAAIVYGHAQSIHVGCVNQYLYLNNASIGLYPHLIQQRELDNRRFGRYRWVALWSGLTVLLRRHHRLKLRMSVDGQSEALLTPMVFFGNNQLQFSDYKMKMAECAAQGKLAVVSLQSVTRWQMFKLIMSVHLGRFEQMAEVHCYCAERIRIEMGGREMKLAIDGEVVSVQSPLQFQVAQHALQVMVPHVTTPV